jgi:hypothetical protein
LFFYTISQVALLLEDWDLSGSRAKLGSSLDGHHLIVHHPFATEAEGVANFELQVAANKDEQSLEVCGAVYVPFARVTLRRMREEERRNRLGRRKKE